MRYEDFEHEKYVDGEDVVWDIEDQTGAVTVKYQLRMTSDQALEVAAILTDLADTADGYEKPEEEETVLQMDSGDDIACNLDDFFATELEGTIFDGY